jgi:Transglycosylase SLT domain
MKALQVACVLGAIAFVGVLYQLGGNTPGATVPQAAARADALEAPAPSATVPHASARIEAAFATMVESASRVASNASVVAPAKIDGDSVEAKSAHLESADTGSAVTGSALTGSANTGSANTESTDTRSADARSTGTGSAGTESAQMELANLGHQDAVEPMPPTPTTRDASDDAPKPPPAPQDFKYLLYYALSELPPAEKPADVVLNAFKDIPAGTPIEEIKRASDAFGLDSNFMKAVAKIESGFKPTTRTGSYIGLFQLSKAEFDKFGSGQITDPRSNAVAAAYKVVTEGILFELVTHKKPTLSDLYLIHQQGWEGAAEHISQPDRIAWKSMCATSEGVQKGQRWCRKAIWRNTLPAVKREWKSVEKLTSAAFVEMWRDRVSQFYSKYMATAAADAERAKQ